MLLELFIVFIKLGLFTIGGGIAMIPILQEAMTKDKKWFTDEEFMDMIAICQSLPGVVAVNMATYVGFKKRGLLGSLIATVGVVTPSWVIIICVATFLKAIGDNPLLAGAMGGFRAAAVGMIICAIIKLCKTVFNNYWAVLDAVLAFALIQFVHINVAYVILLCLALGVASAWVSVLRTKRSLNASQDAEEGGTGNSAEGGDR